MIVYPQFAFAAAPRTGSTWFQMAATAVGMKPLSGNTFQVHDHGTLSGQLFSVTLVREPLDWLCSYYWALKGGSINNPMVDQLCMLARESATVEIFINRYLQEQPGTVSQIFNSYQASTVMKIEDFPWNVLLFFGSIGYQKNHATVVDLGAVNRTKLKGMLPNRVDYLRQVRKAEEEFCERMEYL